jgi:hypothetical protein
LADFLKQLEARIATHPDQAVAHLLWPCFNPDVAARSAPSRPHGLISAVPSRRSTTFVR